MNEYVKSNASKYGLIAAAVTVGYTLLVYLIDLTLMTNTWLGLALWAVGIAILIIGVNQTKKDMGGYISFKDAFSTFIIAYIISALIGNLFTILLFTVIDSDAGSRLQEMTIEATVEMMERFGAPEEQIETQVETLETNNPYSPVNLVKSFFFGIVGYAILGLIVAAIMKKNKPEYLEEEASEE